MRGFVYRSACTAESKASVIGGLPTISLRTFANSQTFQLRLLLWIGPVSDALAIYVIIQLMRLCFLH